MRAHAHTLSVCRSTDLSNERQSEIERLTQECDQLRGERDQRNKEVASMGEYVMEVCLLALFCFCAFVRLEFRRGRLLCSSKAEASVGRDVSLYFSASVFTNTG